MRFRVHDESLNSYGFWVMTKGGDLSDFEKNPICLYNHTRSWGDSEDIILPIGIWEDIKVLKTGEIEMSPVFDDDDQFALKIKKKVEKKHLRTASIGITILEWSEDPQYLKPGQTRATVTKWKMREVSVVDIPSNKNAVMLGDHEVCFYDAKGNVINLSDSAGEHSLPLLLNSNNNNQTISLNMDLKELNKVVSLPDTASLADFQGKLSAIMAENISLKAENDRFKEAEEAKKKNAIETELNEAEKAGKITPTQREVFRSLLLADFENGKAALDAMNVQPSITGFADANSGKKGGVHRDEKGILRLNGKTYDELTRTDEGNAILKDLRSKDVKAFNEFILG